MNHSSKDQPNQENPEFHRIQQDQDLYKQIYKHSTLGILIHDLEMNIISVNEKLLDLFGYTKEEFLAKKVFELHTETELKHSAEVLEKMKKSEKHNTETSFKKKDGSVFHAQITPTKFLVDGKPVVHVYIEDITERKKQEVKLIEALAKAEESEKLQAAFLANMSHEIRTPLTAIIGFSSFLKKPGLGEKSIRNYANIIGESGEHLLSLINDIIDISKIEAGQIEIKKGYINLNELLKELHSFFKSFIENKNKTALELKLNLPEKEIHINSDETRLRQILINLIGNAIKFTEEGKVEFGYREQGDTIGFFVKDTGVGIEEEFKETVFERFKQGTTTDDKFHAGTGLGLSISKAFVELLDGKIWFESQIGKGTNFYFNIPYEAATGEKDKSQDFTEFSFNKETVLIAEDDQYNFEFLEKLLQDNNLEVLRARNGKECIEKVEEYEEIDLILMDIQMPELSGIEAVKKIKKMNPAIPVIAQSAYIRTDNEEELMEAGFDEWISKPINNSALLKLVKKHT